jgi:short subunit dehydrogenase-like uncharacterized protein
MNESPSWMLYGAAGHTGALIAQHAHGRGHRPLLAGRSAPAITALAERLGLPHRALALDDPASLAAALAGVDLVLNAAGPFLHTAGPLAEACLNAGVHYLDIGNELQVFRALYELHERAQRSGVAIIPGVGFGVVATNCLARYVSDAVGGARYLEVATRAATARQGPGIAASVRENLPYGGWTRRAGLLQSLPLGSGITTITLPDGACHVLPFPTGDLEAAFQATGAPDITAYSPVPADPAAASPRALAGAGPGACHRLQPHHSGYHPAGRHPCAGEYRRGRLTGPVLDSACWVSPAGPCLLSAGPGTPSRPGRSGGRRSRWGWSSCWRRG